MTDHDEDAVVELIAREIEAYQNAARSSTDIFSEHDYRRMMARNILRAINAGGLRVVPEEPPCICANRASRCDCEAGDRYREFIAASTD